MKRHHTLVLILLWLLLPGCGRRAVVGVPGAEAGATDGAARDRSVPQDRPVGDACLPIPSKLVQGSYAGTWKGQRRCPGAPSEGVNGKLSFSLSPSGSPDQYKVQGSMSGTVALVMTFMGTISGSMGCTALKANLPDITVSSGAIIYRLRGTMQGTYAYSPASARGFPNGIWNAKDTKGPCTASGTWRATYK